MQPSKKHIDKADVESLPLVSSSPPDKKSGGNSDDAEPHAEPHAEHTQGQSGLPDADKQGHQQAPPWIPGDDLSLLRTIRTAPGHNDRQDCFFALCNVKTKDYTRLLAHLKAQHGLIRASWNPEYDLKCYLTFCPTNQHYLNSKSHPCKSCSNITDLIELQNEHKHNSPVICSSCWGYFQIRREFSKHATSKPCKSNNTFEGKLALLRCLCADILRIQAADKPQPEPQPQPPLPLQSAGPAGPSHLIPSQSTLPLLPPPVLTTPNLSTTPGQLTDTNTTTTTPNTRITPDQFTNTNTTTTTPNAHSTPDQPTNPNPATPILNQYRTPDQLRFYGDPPPACSTPPSRPVKSATPTPPRLCPSNTERPINSAPTPAPPPPPIAAPSVHHHHAVPCPPSAAVAVEAETLARRNDKTFAGSVDGMVGGVRGCEGDIQTCTRLLRGEARGGQIGVGGGGLSWGGECGK